MRVNSLYMCLDVNLCVFGLFTVATVDANPCQHIFLYTTKSATSRSLAIGGLFVLVESIIPPFLFGDYVKKYPTSHIT